MKSLLDYCGCSAAAGRELEARKLPRCSSYFAALPIKKSEERLMENRYEGHVTNLTNIVRLDRTNAV